MNTIIYYFSGTGNSLYAAQKIASELGDKTELLSMSTEPADCPADTAAVVGFVFPVYDWSIPGCVAEYIRKLQINSDAYIFCVATCGSFAMQTLYDFKLLIEEKGMKVAYAAVNHMVGNYVCSYNPNPNPVKRLLKADKELERIIADIRHCKQKNIRYNPLSALLRDKIALGMIRELPEKDKGYRVNDSCTSCGLCEKICAAKNILIENGKPVFHHQCFQCMACIAYCPKHAIDYEDKTQKRTKYHHPDINAVDLMQKRIQI